MTQNNALVSPSFETPAAGLRLRGAVKLAGWRRAAARRVAATLRPVDNDSGMSTIEYAMGSVAAAALAAVLYLVINSGGVEEAFESIITDALNNRPG